MAERIPLVIADGVVSELPVGDTLFPRAGSYAFSPTSVQSVLPVTVPLGQQWVLYSDTLYVDDDLTLLGDLVMLL